MRQKIIRMEIEDLSEEEGRTNAMLIEKARTNEARKKEKAETRATMKATR